MVEEVVEEEESNIGLILAIVIPLIIIIIAIAIPVALFIKRRNKIRNDMAMVSTTSSRRIEDDYLPDEMNLPPPQEGTPELSESDIDEEEIVADIKKIRRKKIVGEENSNRDQ